MLFLSLILLAGAFNFDTFPVLYNNKKVVFIKTKLNTNSSITYNLAKLNPIWCDSDLDQDKPKYEIYINCYGLEKNIFNEIEYEKTNKKIKEEFILESKINPFKFYYYIKNKYYKDNICLIKKNNNFLIYSYIDRKDFNININKAILEFNNLNNDELKNVYLFFISSFNTACLKYLFYYQTAYYGFYNTKDLFIQKNWLN